MTSTNNGTDSLRSRAERNVLRGLVQMPLDAWPPACILRVADFNHYPEVFEVVSNMITSYLRDRRRPFFSQEVLADPNVGIGADLAAVLFEVAHPEMFIEGLNAVLNRTPTNGELSRIGKVANNCEHIAESHLGVATDTEVRTFAGRVASELWDLANKPVVWLVEGVFSCDQPTIFGAKQKSLKTTLLTDLAVALASGYAWLGKFEIQQKRRVLFITGESSEAAAIRKVKRAAESRNLRREDFTDSLRIEAMTFPNLPSEGDCSAVESAVNEHGIEVVLVDPLYMGLQGLNTSNLTEVGPAMRQFMQACRPANVIIAHHVKKSASFDDAPNLEDLSQAGIAEFAGNYWMMGRMSEYTGDGMHELAIRYGGRDEQFGLLKLDFDERNWTANFSNLIDHRDDIKARRDNERANKHLDAIKGHLTRNNGQASLAKLAEAAGTKVNRETFQKIIDELCENGTYERYTFKGGNNKSCDGLRVKGQFSTDSVL